MAKGDMAQLGRQGGMQNMGNMGIGNLSGFGGANNPPPQGKMQNFGMGMQGAAQGMGGLRGMLGMGGGQQQQQPMQNKGFMGRGMQMGGDPRFQGGGQERFNQMMSPFTQYNAQNAAMNNFMNGNIRSGSGLQSNMDVMSPIMSGYGQSQYSPGGNSQPAGEQSAQMPQLPSYGGIRQSQGGYNNPNARY